MAGFCLSFTPGTMLSMNRLEVYERAPVVLVALEIRHPMADPLTPAEHRMIKKRLSERFPLELPGQLTNFQLTSSATTQPEVTTERFPRFLDRTKTISVSVRRGALVIEASRYPGWSEFRELLAEALDARMETAPVAGVERTGLRYINEVRVPTDGDIDWAEWMHPSLLGPRSNTEMALPLGEWQGIGIYGSQPGQMLVCRYGPREGFAIDPSSDLRRSRPADGGPFFLIDIDSFWTPADEVPKYEREMLLMRCEELHEPIRTLFEGIITDRLRDEVLRTNG
jgi:uncharacterized protein (TIGR04255 family)